ncbi:polysaccharide biosynthesis tyrosine autokinase [Pseudoclavibacter soli]|uniref:polysaccharide biosynthesis tyrosine autokinase n=1 Tax=Pseudoclavibacter soli TaxID=452623 RepID=UPI0003F6FFE7|nr:polysaccharide biosynthesis tyrosine autokinase [Pseudoclavibacter soli]
MTVQEYWKIARRYWMLIVGALIAGVVLATAVTLFMPKKYQATASGFISVPASQETASGSVSADTYAKSRAKSYVELGQSKSVAEKVISRLGLTTTPAALLGQVSVTAPTNTVTIQVTATARTAQASADLANAWIDELTEQINEVESAWKQTGTEGSETPVSTLVTYDEATAPTSASSPKLMLNVAIGGLAGLVLGAGAAIALTVFDRRLRSAEAITEQFDVAIMGKLPETNWFTKHKSRLLAEETQHSRTKGDATTAFREALRELRTNIQYVDVDHPVRALMVTSSLPGEGKSTVAANLAVALADAGETVVLIDGDLRRPTVAKTFGLSSGAGVTDVLAGRAELGAVLQRWRLGTELYLLPAGHLPPNPSELLGSDAMTDLLRELSGYAIILIDAPPTLPVTDAAVLSTKVDGVIVAVVAGKTTSDQLGTTLEHLHRVKANIYGVVLNRVPTKGIDSEGYGYYSSGYTSNAPAKPVTVERVAPLRADVTADGRLRVTPDATAAQAPVKSSARPPRAEHADKDLSFDDLLAFSKDEN